jgi:hypothetical protein
MRNCLKEIKLLYKHYIDDPQYVYKICSDSWIVIMKKLPDTITNEERHNVIDPRYAKFRADKLDVCIIFSVADPLKTQKSIMNTRGNKTLLYTINEIVKPDCFDNEPDIVCTTGIHYFKSICAAYYFRQMSFLWTGNWITWYENGQMKAKGDYLMGEKTGHWITWYQDGKMKTRGNYLNGKKTGYWVAWYPEGQMELAGDYLENEKTGRWIVWYPDGQIKLAGNYLENEKTGRWVEWNDNGDIMFEDIYICGEKTGHWVMWSEGQIMCEGDYPDNRS